MICVCRGNETDERFALCMVVRFPRALRTHQIREQAHVIEHLLAAQLERTSPTRDLLTKGLWINGETGPDDLCLYITGPEALLDAVPVLMQRLLNPLEITPEQLQREKTIIDLEVAEHSIFDLRFHGFLCSIFGHSEPESLRERRKKLRQISVADCSEFWEKCRVERAIRFSVVTRSERAAEKAVQAFAQSIQGPSIDPEPATIDHRAMAKSQRRRCCGSGGDAILHLMYRLPVESFTRVRSRVLRSLIDHGPASALWDALRGEKPYAYHFGTRFIEGFDFLVFLIGCSYRSRDHGKVTEALGRIMTAMANSEICSDRLSLAKERTIEKFRMLRDHNLMWSQFMAREALRPHRNRVLSSEEEFETEVRSITIEDVSAFASQLFATENEFSWHYRPSYWPFLSLPQSGIGLRRTNG